MFSVNCSDTVYELVSMMISFNKMWDSRDIQGTKKNIYVNTPDQFLKLKYKNIHISRTKHNFSNMCGFCDVCLSV